MIENFREPSLYLPVKIQNSKHPQNILDNLSTKLDSTRYFERIITGETMRTRHEMQRRESCSKDALILAILFMGEARRKAKTPLKSFDD